MFDDKKLWVVLDKSADDDLHVVNISDDFDTAYGMAYAALGELINCLTNGDIVGFSCTRLKELKYDAGWSFDYSITDNNKSVCTGTIFILSNNYGGE